MPSFPTIEQIEAGVQLYLRLMAVEDNTKCWGGSSIDAGKKFIAARGKSNKPIARWRHLKLLYNGNIATLCFSNNGSTGFWSYHWACGFRSKNNK